AERLRLVRDHQWSSTAACDALDDFLQVRGRRAAIFLDEMYDLVGRAFTDSMSTDVDAAHPGLRGKRYEGGADLAEFAAAQVVFALGQHDDRPSFGSLVGQRRELCGFGEFALRHA